MRGLEDRNLLKLRSLDSSCPFFVSNKSIWGQMLRMLWSQGQNSLHNLQMLQSLREETEGKLQMQLSPRKNGLDSLFKEVRVFKGWGLGLPEYARSPSTGNPPTSAKLRFWTLFGLFWAHSLGTLGPPRGRRPRNTLSDSFRTLLGVPGPGDLCSWSGVPKPTNRVIRANRKFE